jgi:hypothetical protein
MPTFSHTYSSLRSKLLLLTSILLINLIFWRIWRSYSQIADENKLMECLQALFLSIGGAMYVVRARSSTFATLDWMLYAGMALLMYSFLLRELDIDQLGISPAWTTLEQYLRMIGVLAWVGFGVIAVPRFNLLFANTMRIAQTPLVVLSVIGGLFLLAGWPFDKSVLTSLSHVANQFGEEIFELDAYLILLLGSLAQSVEQLAMQVTHNPREESTYPRSNSTSADAHEVPSPSRLTQNRSS